jgi:hypothetical protein
MTSHPGHASDTSHSTEGLFGGPAEKSGTPCGVHFSSQTDLWATPDDFFQELDRVCEILHAQRRRTRAELERRVLDESALRQAHRQVVAASLRELAARGRGRLLDPGTHRHQVVA